MFSRYEVFTCTGSTSLVFWLLQDLQNPSSFAGVNVTQPITQKYRKASGKNENSCGE